MHGSELLFVWTATTQSTDSGPLLLQDVPLCRKTKIVCTMGPASWSAEGLASLLDAGLNVARFNFSHGDHKGHLEVLERVRKVRTLMDRFSTRFSGT